MKNENYINKVFYTSATNMDCVPNDSVDLIVTSPPYFNIKDYNEGTNKSFETKKNKDDVGSINSVEKYLDKMDLIWNECQRVLRPNGKLVINVPLMPMIKKNYSTHYNRDILDLQSLIQNRVTKMKDMYLMDLYIWNRTNSTKKLMFGSYPHPNNFYNNNIVEFMTVYVKDGKPKKIDKKIKEESALTKEEWLEFTKQIWEIPIPNKSDKAFGKHPAIMPEEIVRRFVKMFSFKNDVVLDPFTGSGTTLKVAKENGRNYIGFELYEKNYREIIEEKLNDAE